MRIKMQLYNPFVIIQIKEDFDAQPDYDLEMFLRNNFYKYKLQFNLSEGALLVNCARLCLDCGIDPQHFYDKVYDLLDGDDDWY